MRNVFMKVILLPLALASACMLFIYSIAPIFCQQMLHQTLRIIRNNNRFEYVNTTNADRIYRKLGKVAVMYHDSRHDNIILLRLLCSEGIIMPIMQNSEGDLAA